MDINEFIQNITESNDGILYQLECIIGFAQNIHANIDKAGDITTNIQKVYDILAEISDKVDAN